MAAAKQLAQQPKRANPIVLLDFLRFGKEFGATEEELQRVFAEYSSCILFLSTPAYARQMGVMLEDGAQQYPFAFHSIQGWAGCAVAAAGFAGIALAQMLQPGIIFLQKNTH